MLEDLLLELPPEANYQLADPSLLDYYINRKNRIFWLTSEIDDKLYGLVQLL